MLKKSFKKLKCPFNPEHIVPEDRMQRHIIKCMKNYPDHFTCPYNAMHRFLIEAEYKRHVLNCPDKMCTMSWKRVDNRNSVPIHLDLPKCDTEENWDDN